MDIQRVFFILLLKAALFVLGACSSGGSSDDSGGFTPPVDNFTASLEKLSDADYQSLSEGDQFAVSNKATGALLKGGFSR